MWSSGIEIGVTCLSPNSMERDKVPMTAGEIRNGTWVRPSLKSHDHFDTLQFSSLINYENMLWFGCRLCLAVRFITTESL